MGIGTWMAAPATRAGTYAVIGGAGAIGSALILSVGKIKSIFKAGEQEILDSESKLISIALELKKQDTDALCAMTYEHYSQVFPELIEAYSNLASMFLQLKDAGSLATPRNAYPWDLEERVLVNNSSNFTVQEWEARRAKKNCPPLPVQPAVSAAGTMTKQVQAASAPASLSGSTPNWMKPAAYFTGAFAAVLLGYWMYTQAGGKKGCK